MTYNAGFHRLELKGEDCAGRSRNVTSVYNEVQHLTANLRIQLNKRRWTRKGKCRLVCFVLSIF